MLTAPMDPVLDRLINQAVHHLHRRLDDCMPRSSGALWHWFGALAPGGCLSSYFKHLHAFPTFLFPWWLEEALSCEPDPEFHGALSYSSVSGYLAIRLVDDAMDAKSPSALHLLPAVWFLGAEFQSTYADYFDPGHRFWGTFEQMWAKTSDAAISDGRARIIDRESFEKFSSQKVAAGKIPLTAVSERRGRRGLDVAWSAFFDRYSRWHQMFNDLLDWPRDQANGTMTFFLSSAEKRRKKVAIEQWIIEEGFTWAFGLLNEWMDELKDLARGLGSPGLVQYLELRAKSANTLFESASPGLAELSRLFSLGKTGAPNDG